MELIDKDKVVKEIERRIANHNKELERASDEDFVSSWASDEELQKLALTALIPFLNTLEVKEVDLEKEFYDFLDTLIGKDNGHLSEDELFSIAEHFYELGLNAKKGK